MSDQQLNSDAIAAVAALAKESMRTGFIHRPGDPPHIVHQVTPDGKVERQTVEPLPLDSHLATPEAFVEFVKAIGSVGTSLIANSTVFYSEVGLVFVQVLAERRDKATCLLDRSEQFEWLENSARKQQFKQHDFIRLLRINLAGCLPGDSGLLALVRNLKWSTSATVTGVVQQGRESMGKQIDSLVNGESAIPEEITLTVPVFANYGFEAIIRCAIDVSPAEQVFRLVPYPNQLELAKQGAMAAIRLTLTKQPAPLFFGSP